ncbi:YciI family protein [Nocardia sp. NBC_01327]|uniref:YciI family protein n=1 Tax=Nocardia sp. NBC_01327 TaxID=2903593 RepID=UPI002E0D82AB|nr:YciI family protein [Nocardia sp. NBC_01327]
MKQYLLSIYQPAETDPPDNLDEIMRDLAVLNDEMRAAGAWVFTAGLHPPSTATVLQASGSEVLITDGPYAEGKEQIGGFTVIQAGDLDEALEWGRRLARVVTLPIEVRPMQDR